jgi:predicted Zn-ribbon and HTH transcriptional regulator
MSVLVVCRHCGAEFEIDVLQVAGPWWTRCPHCYPEMSADQSPDELSETPRCLGDA